MEDQGLRGELRRLILRRDVFGLAIAVAVGMAIFQLLYSAVEWVGLPFAAGFFHDRSSEPSPYGRPLYFTYHSYLVNLGEVVALAVVLGVIALLVLVLRKRISFAGDEYDDEGEDEEAEGFRTCPECLSQIPSGARRCSYCTAEVGTAAASERQE